MFSLFKRASSSLVFPLNFVLPFVFCSFNYRQSLPSTPQKKGVHYAPFFSLSLSLSLSLSPSIVITLLLPSLKRRHERMIQLLTAVLWAVGMAWNLISISVFKGGALVIWLTNLILKIPWTAVSEVLGLLITAIRSGAEWFVESFVYWFLSFIVDLFKLAPRAASGLVALASNATGIVQENMYRIEPLVELLPGIFRFVAGTAKSVGGVFVYGLRLVAYYVRGKC